MELLNVFAFKKKKKMHMKQCSVPVYRDFTLHQKKMLTSIKSLILLDEPFACNHNIQRKNKQAQDGCELPKRAQRVPATAPLLWQGPQGWAQRGARTTK